MSSLGRVQGSPWRLATSHPSSQGHVNGPLWPFNGPFSTSCSQCPSLAQKTKKLPRELWGCPDEALRWRSAGQTGPHVSNPTGLAGPLCCLGEAWGCNDAQWLDQNEPFLGKMSGLLGPLGSPWSPRCSPSLLPRPEALWSSVPHSLHLDRASGLWE